MTAIQEIETAVRRLPHEGLAAFREWFKQFDAKESDRQFGGDVIAGRLDALADEPLRVARSPTS